jgi:carbon starvation protein
MVDKMDFWFSRRVKMTTTLLIVLALLVYIVFYRTYGKSLERGVVKADPSKPTPAHKFRDEVDFIPARRSVLFGHHFASIAGVSPIVGPAIAMAWGWLPALIWVWFGNVFIGAVHDYLSLMASVRYDGHSIQWIAGELISKRTRKFFEVFILFLLILVIAAFSSIISKIFVSLPQVSTTSIFFIIVAVLTGWLLYRIKVSLPVATLMGIILISLSIYGGTLLPLHLPYKIWLLLLLIYIIIAASLPVWVLLQPRDYLNAYILWFGLILGGVALLFSFHSMETPSFTRWSVPIIENIPSPLWPTILLIIACGSLSGFHSLVASGTTSKQLDKEIDGLFVGFGGMFTEGFLSTIVIVSIGAFGLIVLGEGLGKTFAEGYGEAIEKIGGPVGIFSRSYSLAVHEAFRISVKIVNVFASLWVAAFALTTLDTTNRIGRFVLAELVEPLKERNRRFYELIRNKWVASLLVSVLGIWLAWGGAWRVIWPAFSGANQLLASIALLTVSLWVISLKGSRRFILLVILPALFLWFTVTVALFWYLIYVMPHFIEKSLFQALLLILITLFEIILNLILFKDFVAKIIRG